MNEHEKPFSAGQLVRYKGRDDIILYLVLEMRWNPWKTWWSRVLEQSTGEKIWMPSYFFANIERTDEKKPVY